MFENHFKKVSFYNILRAKRATFFHHEVGTLLPPFFAVNYLLGFFFFCAIFLTDFFFVIFKHYENSRMKRKSCSAWDIFSLYCILVVERPMEKFGEMNMIRNPSSSSSNLRSALCFSFFFPGFWHTLIMWPKTPECPGWCSTIPETLKV